jgi:hypothetical protein
LVLFSFFSFFSPPDLPLEKTCSHST